MVETILWNTIFIFGILIFGGALGLLSGRSIQSLRMSSSGRFLLGFSSSPLVLGLYIMAMSLLPFNAHQAIIILPVWAFSVIVYWRNWTSVRQCISFCLESISNFGIYLSKYWLKLCTLISCVLPASGLYIFRTTSLDAERWASFAVEFEKNPWGARLGYYLPLVLAGIFLLAPLVACLLKYGFHKKLKQKRYWAVFLLIPWYLYFLYEFFKMPLKSFANPVFLPALTTILFAVGAAYVWIDIPQAMQSDKWRTGDRWDSARIATQLETFFRHLLYFLVGFTVLFAIYLAFMGANMPHWFGDDITQYVGQSKYFLDHFSPEGIIGILGSPDGALVGDSHQFAWCGYLAYAMLHCFGTPGYGNDPALAAAALLTVVFAAAGVLAALSFFQSKRVSCLGLVLFLGLSGTHLIFQGLSRDGFRLAGLLFLFTALIAVLESQKWQRQKKLLAGHLLFPMAGAAFAVIGHPISIMGAIPIALSLFSWLLIRKQLNLRAVAVAASAGVGALLGAIHLIINWVTTGSASGDYVAVMDVLIGTPYEASSKAFMHGRIEGNEHYLQRIVTIFGREGNLVMYFGVIAVIVLLVLVLKSSIKSRTAPVTLLAAFVYLFSLLMINDLFVWYGDSMSRWLVMNPRYQYHIAWFATYAVCALYAQFVHSPVRVGTLVNTLPTVTASVLSLATAWICIFPVAATIQPYYLPVLEIDRSYYGQILTNNNSLAYCLDNQVTSILTMPARDLLLAEDPETFAQRLAEHNIRVIVVENNYNELFFKDGPMGQYLRDKRNFSQIDKTNPRITIYYLIDTP